jgi:hypothetical protein
MHLDTFLKRNFFLLIYLYIYIYETGGSIFYRKKIEFEFPSKKQLFFSFKSNNFPISWVLELSPLPRPKNTLQIDAHS